MDGILRRSIIKENDNFFVNLKQVQISFVEVKLFSNSTILYIFFKNRILRGCVIETLRHKKVNKADFSHEIETLKVKMGIRTKYR